MSEAREGARAGGRGSAGAQSEKRPPFRLDPRDLIDLSFEAIVVRRPQDRRIVYWSPGAERIYGWPADDALGRTDLPDGARPGEASALQEEVLRHGSWEGVIRQRHRDGSVMTVLARWSVHRDEHGHPDAIVEVNSNITRQADAEARLGTSEEMFRLLVDSVRDYAIFLLDPAGHVASWNLGAARIKGYQASEIIGKHFSAFYPPDDVRAGKPDWELVVAADSGRFEDEGWRVRRDGSRFWANVVITALRDGNGTLRGFGKVTRDLTARREAELERLDRERAEAEAARAHAARLAELEKTKTEFLNLASHELRGPLAVARGYISLLLDGSLSPDEFHEHAGVVAGRLAQMESLVQKMLETARLEYRHLNLKLAEVDVREIVREQVDRKSVV